MSIGIYTLIIIVCIRYFKERKHQKSVNINKEVLAIENSWNDYAYFINFIW